MRRRDRLASIVSHKFDAIYDHSFAHCYFQPFLLIILIFLRIQPELAIHRAICDYIVIDIECCEVHPWVWFFDYDLRCFLALGVVISDTLLDAEIDIKR